MHALDLDATIGRSRFGRFHLRIVALCGLVILFDGYDLTIYGAAVPRMIAEFGITPATAGLIGSAALVGMMIGAMVFGTVADRVGRRMPIIVCVLLYTVFTGAVFLATTPWEVGLYRFLAGLGLGGVMPNAVALSTEYAPSRLRNTLVSVMFSGYMIGGIAAALVGIVFIPAFGWRSLYLVGALLLVVVPFLVKFLPEAPEFLLRRGRTDELAATLRAIDPDLPRDGDLAFATAGEKPPAAPVASLFRNGYALPTAMLWVAFFMVLLMIYGLLTWLPQLMIEVGYPLGSSLSFLMALFVAVIVITWGRGYAADRFGPVRSWCSATSSPRSSSPSSGSSATAHCCGCTRRLLWAGERRSRPRSSPMPTPPSTTRRTPARPESAEPSASGGSAPSSARCWVESCSPPTSRCTRTFSPSRSPA